MAPRIYLAGPLTDVEEPQMFHEILKDKAPYSVDWIDPLDVEDGAGSWEKIYKDLTSVERADGVIVYRVPGVESWGTKFEVFHAMQSNTPLVIWDTSSSSNESHNQWLQEPFVLCDDPDEALYALGSLMRVS